VRHALRPYTTIIIAESQFKYPFDFSHIAIRSYQHLGEGLDFDEVMRFRKELKEAIAAYRKAICLQDNNPDAHFYLGVLLDMVGDKDSSAMAMRKARDLTEENDHRHANYWLSAILEDLGDRSAAFDAYKDTYNIAHRFEPWSMISHSDLDQAMHQLRSALELRLDIVDVANRVGLMLSRKGYYTRAVLEFHTALHEDSKNARTLNNLGLTYGRSGDLARAIEEFRKAIELRPDYVPARANLATALERSGDPYGAAEEYRQLAEVYRGQSNRKDAARAYKKYLQTMPDEPANAGNRTVVKKLLEDLER